MVVMVVMVVMVGLFVVAFAQCMLRVAGWPCCQVLTDPAFFRAALTYVLCACMQLIYVKEDLLIPHHHTFYEFIVNKVRGKSGPLFNFDVHDDIR
jgi:hypothetical protein